MTLQGETAILYDFERGDLHCYGAVWVVWPPDSRKRRETTREEFDRAVRELESLPQVP